MPVRRHLSRTKGATTEGRPYKSQHTNLFAMLQLLASEHSRSPKLKPSPHTTLPLRIVLAQ